MDSEPRRAGRRRDDNLEAGQEVREQCRLCGLKRHRISWWNGSRRDFAG